MQISLSVVKNIWFIIFPFKLIEENKNQNFHIFHWIHVCVWEIEIKKVDFLLREFLKINFLVLHRVNIVNFDK